ncbi:LLM class flavin-dependent oxidoreductase [Pontibacter silvestris]|uniref:LLM class flavin-dependent oxidoreductase n=1 Tax=Pontibacter silvestris TaxID=2305183 RepID=A0ABW4X4D1_9BACT|nr:LLM class flavin-dependent oxidoreductase [Pontibacter silvestris]MCC9137938.1 LLM class flavin-dependent oxidoreductase [Pontibacter silvestris]
MPKKIRLSVLDQSPIRKRGTAAQALMETIELAKLTDELGYTRFWVSEHHNTTGLAGSSPEVLIPYLASVTKRIRVGSGGVMLPHYSALKVAENFKVLENLFPDRIDLGIGRAPGTDRVTAAALNPHNQFSDAAFMQQLKDLGHYLHDTSEEGDITENVYATPATPSVPLVWLLSSSGQSGLFAAHFGFGFSFAHFINPVGGEQMVKAYKQHFEKSRFMQQPEANVGVFVMCAETEEKAQELQETMDLMMLRIEKGRSSGVPSYEEVKIQQYSEAEQLRIEYNRQRMVSGTPMQVKLQLEEMAKTYEVDELIVVTITHSFEDRKSSYRLLAEAFELC